MVAGEQTQPVSWGLLRQETISGHGKTQQLELRQPPPSLKNIPAEGGFGSRVKGEGWGMAWQRNEAQESIAVLCHSYGVTRRDAGEEPWLRCRIHPSSMQPQASSDP